MALKGHVHPLARPEFDRGAVAPSIPMDSIILSLRLPPGKQAAMEQLLVEQQVSTSPNYHRWLTPEEFGERFGPAAEDIAAVTGWLTSQGFTVNEVARGRSWINFSGRVSDVEHAFHTKIHSYYVNGRFRQANATEPSIPRGLADLVAGPVSLHNFPRRAMSRNIRPLMPEETQPDYTTSGGNHYLAPGDFAVIYNLNSLYGTGIDGTGQAIAITGRTHPSSSNWSTFRSKYGLPDNPPQVIVNGTDPGDLGADEDFEADLDVEWSGAVAKNAVIRFVVSASTNTSDGVDLSAQYIVNHNVAPVMSTSFGSCEAQMGSDNTFFSNLWAQAAIQGITSFVSTGDAGAAGCDDPNSVSSGTGRAVNGLASTPYNVAVGGSQFNEGVGTYWNSANATDGTSAVGYIPETTWNESAGVSGGSGIWATGGGASLLYGKPVWQVSPGVPADGKRDIPDVSLTASGHDGYRIQSNGSTYIISGTSASSPSFAGIMALLVQKTGQHQGNANPRLYQLGNAQYGAGGAAVFHDITSGSNSVPGVTGYNCSTGYDPVTGLGSVNAYNLLVNWDGVVPDFTLAAPAAVSAAQGGTATAVITTTVTGGFNGLVALTASGLPTGATATFSPASIAAPGSGNSTLTLSAGAATPVGVYSVTVTGTGGGKTHTTTVSFTVTAVLTITPSAGSGGILSPGGPRSISAGNTGVFAIIPVPGYHIVSVTGCGGTLAGTTYTTAPVNGNCTVTALFAKSDAVFDEFAYLLANPDVAAVVKSGGLPGGWEHYSLYGRNEGRPLTPNGYGFYRELPYLLANPDLQQALLSGIITSGWQHYILYGKNEGRPLVPAGFNNYSEETYLAANPDVAAVVKSGGISSGWVHYRGYGKNEGRALSPVGYGSFKEEGYLFANPDIAAALTAGIVSSGWEHYNDYGRNEGRPAAPAGYVIYNESAYLAANPDIAAVVKSGSFDSGWTHYILYGKNEGRTLAPAGYANFNEEAYLAANPDVAPVVKAGGLANGWVHYRDYGKGEGRPLNPAGYGSFSESDYLAANTDVFLAVVQGVNGLTSGWGHYILYGKSEGRPLHP